MLNQAVWAMRFLQEALGVQGSFLVYLYKLDGPASDAEFEEMLVTQYPDGLAAAWELVASNQVKLTCFEIQRVRPVPVGTKRSQLIDLPGGVAGPMLPTRVAGMVRLGGGDADDRGRGSLSLMGMLESQWKQGRADAASQDQWGSLLNWLFTPIDLGDGNFAAHCVKTPNGVGFVPVIRTELRSRIILSRRRVSKLCGVPVGV